MNWQKQYLQAFVSLSLSLGMESNLENKMSLIRIIFIIAFYFSIITQTCAGEITSYGIKFGANFAKSSGNFATTPSYKTAFSVGAFSVYNLSDQFSIQPELLYSIKGYKLDGKDFQVDATFEYLELPLLAKFLVSNTNTLLISLLLGPSVSYNLDAKFTTKIPGASFSGKIPNFNTLDFGAIVGFSILFPVNEGNIVFDARYNLGLTNWDEKHTDYKNRVITTSVGYSF